MESSSFLFSVAITLFTVAVLSPDGCSSQLTRGEKHKALFVFGDSLFDAGNNQYLSGSSNSTLSTTKWPYGETYFKHPTGRFSDGRTVPDFIATFAKLPILAPYLQPGAHQFAVGTNFASGGAGVLSETHPGTINLRLQLWYFKAVEKSLKKKLGAAGAKGVLSNAVYLFSIGGNDYFGFSMNANASQSYRTQYVDMVIGNLTSVLREVYMLGGRKIAFQNVGPLGCIPSMRARSSSNSGTCFEEPTALARRHNRYLSVALKKLQSELPGFKYAIFDYYNALRYMGDNPSKYGLKEGKTACCGSGAYRANNCGGGTSGKETYELCSNPADYVWWDGGHTTESANFKLAKMLWNGGSDVIGPLNVKQLFESV